MNKIQIYFSRELSRKPNIRLYYLQLGNYIPILNAGDQNANDIYDIKGNQLEITAVRGGQISPSMVIKA